MVIMENLSVRTLALEILQHWQNDFDTPWKDALESYFQEFMTFFFPEAAAAIDWTAGYEFLDKELQAILRDGEIGKRYADKLVRVRLQNGTESWILVHIEIQGQQEAEFAKRMFVYNYRIFDKYDQPVASLALLTDASPVWRPHEYSYSAFGSSMHLTFPSVKMLDFADAWSDLEASNNPFAIIVMAHLKALDKGLSPEDRMKWKFQIASALYRKDFSKQDIVRILILIDWLITLPPGLQERFRTNIDILEKKNMPYLSSFERNALLKGLEQGLQQGIQQGIQQEMQQSIDKVLQLLRNNILYGIQTRFGEPPETVVEPLARIDDAERLNTILHALFTTSSLDDILSMIR